MTVRLTTRGGKKMKSLWISFALAAFCVLITGPMTKTPTAKSGMRVTGLGLAVSS